uniref:Protein PRRC2C-like n=1 Tax=Cyprinodon variegatus TaxID=28743 RepID=A0A3Q2D2P1_CYPVA
MTQLEASEAGGEPPSSYIIFLVVFLFFLTGLLGFLICHLLKKKGYRCRTVDPEDEEDNCQLETGSDANDENQDTVEQILKCIMENEANMEAFNEMLGNRSVCVRHDPRLRKESLGGVPPHLHTVHSGTDHNSCLLCAQVRAKKGRRQSRTPRFKQQPGEQTVFSVGRFRVTHSDKKFQGRPNPLAASGEQLDQSQDSDDIKEDGFNLKNMFKEVQPASDGVHGVAANVGKRKKSMTLFGLRRGSDPLGLRVKERAGADPRGVRFAVQRPPVVLEEPANPEPANTVANNRESTAANTVAKTAANTEDSTVAKTVANTGASTAANTGASTATNTAANTEDSTAANTAASTAANTAANRG